MIRPATATPTTDMNPLAMMKRMLSRQRKPLKQEEERS